MKNTDGDIRVWIREFGIRMCGDSDSMKIAPILDAARGVYNVDVAQGAAAFESKRLETSAIFINKSEYDGLAAWAMALSNADRVMADEVRLREFEIDGHTACTDDDGLKQLIAEYKGIARIRKRGGRICFESMKGGGPINAVLDRILAYEANARGIYWKDNRDVDEGELKEIARQILGTGEA